MSCKTLLPAGRTAMFVTLFRSILLLRVVGAVAFGASPSLPGATPVTPGSIGHEAVVEAPTARLPAATFPFLPGDPIGTPSLIQTRYGNRTMLELASPSASGGILLYARDNDTPGMPWYVLGAIGRSIGVPTGVSWIQGNYGDPGNLELVAVAGGKLWYFWRDSGADRAWRGPYLLASQVRGAPSLIQSRFGVAGDFLLAVPNVAGGIGLYYRSNDDAALPWRFGGRVGVGVPALFSGASLIESNYGHPGNFELVGTAGGAVYYFWGTGLTAPDWHGPFTIAGHAGGPPSLIQSRFGVQGNFEMLVPSDDDGIDFYWRDNDTAGLPWRGPFRIHEALGRVGAVSLIQGTLGASQSNFELMIQTADRLDFSFRDEAGWQGPFAFVAPIQLPGFPGKPSSLRKAYTQWLGPLVTFPGRGGNADLAGTGLGGTDLGASFEYQGRLAFLFGDSWVEQGDAGNPFPGQNVANPNGFNQDSIAWTGADSVGRFGIPRLNFVRTSDQARFAPIQAFSPLRVTLDGTIGHGGMEVPVEGFELNGRPYVFFVTGWWEQPGPVGFYTHSVLAHRGDLNQARFDADQVVRSERFLNVSLIQREGYFYIYGAGNPYRKSRVYLARVPVADITDRSRWEYFRGTMGGQPVFGPWEHTAAAIIDTDCVGELSVRRHAASGLSLMAYNCGEPYHRGIHLRTARLPWGPWSSPEYIMDLATADPFEPAYTTVMHVNRCWPGAADDGLAEPWHFAARTKGDPAPVWCAGTRAGDAWGGEYGPYLIPRWFSNQGSKEAYSIIWAVSSWNPYKAHLMETVLAPRGKPLPRRPAYGADLPPARLVNGAFERGDLSGWQLAGGPFAVFARGSANYVTTFVGSAGGDAVQGVLARSFRVDAGTRALRFTVHGGHARVRLYHRGVVVRETRGLDSNDFELPVVWNLIPFHGETVRVSIEDDLNEPWGFISVSGFTLERFD